MTSSDLFSSLENLEQNIMVYQVSTNKVSINFIVIVIIIIIIILIGMILYMCVCVCIYVIMMHILYI